MTTLVAVDQAWLDEQIAAINDDLDDAEQRVIAIMDHWPELAPLHPGVSAADYILDHIDRPLGRKAVFPLLTQTPLSNRQIAAVAGVPRRTVDRIARGSDDPPVRPRLGADGKTYRPPAPRQPEAAPPGMAIAKVIHAIDHFFQQVLTHNGKAYTYAEVVRVAAANRGEPALAWNDLPTGHYTTEVEAAGARWCSEMQELLK